MAGYYNGPFSDQSGAVEPDAPCGANEGVGTVPSFGQAETVPPNPQRDLNKFTGFPDASGETEPGAPVIDGVMPMNRGKAVGSL